MLWDSLLKIRKLACYNINNSNTSNNELQESIRKLREFDSDLVELLNSG